MLREFEDINPGNKLGDSHVIPTRTQLFMFSAITWNRHQIHFDRDQAVNEGLSDVVVQRGLIGNFLEQYLTEWISGRGVLKNIQWKVIQSTYPGVELKISGEIESMTSYNLTKDICCTLEIVNKTNDKIAVGFSKIQLNTFIARR